MQNDRQQLPPASTSEGLIIALVLLCALAISFIVLTFWQEKLFREKAPTTSTPSVQVTPRDIDLSKASITPRTQPVKSALKGTPQSVEDRIRRELRTDLQSKGIILSPENFEHYVQVRIKQHELSEEQRLRLERARQKMARSTESIVITLPKFTPTDTDGDGLYDDWEQYYFGSLEPKAEEDPDQDGRSNFMEQGTHNDWRTNPTKAEFYSLNSLRTPIFDSPHTFKPPKQMIRIFRPELKKNQTQ